MMKKIFFLVMCCLFLCGCEKQQQVTVCVRMTTPSDGSVTMYKSKGNNITHESLGWMYEHESVTAAIDTENELLNTDFYKSRPELIERYRTTVYEWTIKNGNSNGNLNDSIKKLENDEYTCVTEESKDAKE